LDCFIFSDDFAKIKFGISNRWFKWRDVENFGRNWVLVKIKKYFGNKILIGDVNEFRSL
jgi:hypothetical protein